jgi:hypothetical protein
MTLIRNTVPSRVPTLTSRFDGDVGRGIGDGYRRFRDAANPV